MVSQSLLLVDDQPVSLEQALKYLQNCGKLGPFIGDILRQYVIDLELQKLGYTQIETALVEQAIIDFRLQNQLTDPKRFQEWLVSKNVDYPTFHNQFANTLRVEKLKAQAVAPRLQEYYAERKVFLDRVVLSRIIVDTQEMAKKLFKEIEQGASFEQLAREHSLGDERIANGMMGAISRGTLPEALGAAVDSAMPGQILGPLQVDGRWGLFRFEQFIPVTLEDAQLRQVLMDEMFERWLGEKLQKLNVKLQIG